jgi:hypothetical protein
MYSNSIQFGGFDYAQPDIINYAQPDTIDYAISLSRAEGLTLSTTLSP